MRTRERLTRPKANKRNPEVPQEQVDPLSFPDHQLLAKCRKENCILSKAPCRSCLTSSSPLSSYPSLCSPSSPPQNASFLLRSRSGVRLGHHGRNLPSADPAVQDGPTSEYMFHSCVNQVSFHAWLTHQADMTPWTQMVLSYAPFLYGRPDTRLRYEPSAEHRASGSSNHGYVWLKKSITRWINTELASTAFVKDPTS